MATSLAWTDDTGAATLTNGKGSPWDRLKAWRNWSPTTDRNADTQVAVASGATSRWRFRTDHLAAFELAMIPMASLDLLQRLKDHLEGGGQVTVTVGDVDEHVYVCTIAPGTTVEYEQSDSQMLEYSLQVTLRNVANLPLLVDYSAEVVS